MDGGGRGRGEEGEEEGMGRERGGFQAPLASALFSFFFSPVPEEGEGKRWVGSILGA